jgi:ferredoxin
MAIVFAAVALYQLPGWVQRPAMIMEFAAVLAFGLALDTMANFIRFRKPVCAVSAAVTAAMLQALAPGAPLWGRLLAVAVALLAGKHAWGGTGKNPVNPAMVGLLLLGLLFPIRFPPFAPSLLLVPAVLLSLPFLVFRPFAATGMMAGMAASLLLNQGLTLSSAAAYGIVFWGCLVATDPVTITPHPFAGTAAGLLAGFVPLYFSGTAASMAMGVLAANAVSFAAERMTRTSWVSIRLSFGKGKRIPFSTESTACLDMTGREASQECAADDFSRDEILGRIERSGVFGMGGAAFPSCKKIMAVADSKAEEKHFIVNGVECDPGLIHDKWLLRNHPDEIAQGIRLLMKCIPFRSVTIAVKDSTGLASQGGVRTAEVPDYYPAGAERILIREVLKKALPAGAIPATEGILVLNAQTVYSIYEAVCLDRKADQRFITVANVTTGEAQVARVNLGVNVNEVVERIYPAHGSVFTGGGMMQARFAGDGDQIGSTVNFVAIGSFPLYRESPLCSKCGLCAAVCPARLKVYEISRLADEGKPQQTQRFHPEKCISCGCCSHVCLAGRNLSTRVKAAKSAMLEPRS